MTFPSLTKIFSRMKTMRMCRWQKSLLGEEPADPDPISVTDPDPAVPVNSPRKSFPMTP